MRIVRYATFAIICLAAACGANVFKAEGTVLNPLYSFRSADNETPRPPRLLVIVRKEIRNVKQYRIVGRFEEPDALKPFREYASIPEQHTDGNTLYVDTRIFSN